MENMTPHTEPGSIFMQPWWLDIVAPGQWTYIDIEKGGDLKARWPIVRKRVKGLKIIEMPLLTQTLGPWIKQESDKPETIHSNERKLLKKLIEKLPEHDKLVVNLDMSVQNHLPFKWSGFEQTSMATYQISGKQDQESAWKGLKSSVRRAIKKADSNLRIEEHENSEILYTMISKTFSRQEATVPYSKALLHTLTQACLERNRCRIISAVTESDQPAVTGMFLFDDDKTYYLCSGFDDTITINGAVNLFVWEGIKESLDHGVTFDFEGSSIESIERFFSSFGAEQKHFHQVRHFSKKFELVNQVKTGKKLLFG
jgi:hypothetical protein